MKKILTIITAVMSVILTVSAQTLNVQQGAVVYLFPSQQTGTMPFDNDRLTIMGKTFTSSSITAMWTDDTEVTDNLVAVAYNGTSATVTVAGNVAQYVEPTVSGAHVTIAQTNTDAVDNNEITYQLSGTTTNGSLTLGGSYKCTVSLAGVTLTNPSGAAINITNSKRIQLSAKKDTENTLTDGTGGQQKACIYSKGQLQLQGNGTLSVTGKTKHGIKSASYITIKNLTLNINAATGDGINCEEYFQMKSGTVTISGVGDDGIQCDLGSVSTGETADHEDEDSGNIYLEGGTLNITTTAVDTKGIKSAGNMSICGGTLTLKATGNGGKCIKSNGTLTISDNADITASSTGSTYTLSNNKVQPKAIKSNGAMTISGGSVNATSNGHEAIETKSTLTISGGTVYALSPSDDAINSASHMYLQGGTVTSISNGNDGLDSNGNMYISGGTIIACGAGTPECGLDAAERYYLYITGGTVLAIGGGNNTVTSISGSQCLLSTSGSATADASVTVKNGSTTLASFTVPNGYSPTSGGGPGGGGGWRPGGGGPGGSGSSGYSYLLSCPGLTSGSSYTVTIGSTSTSCKAATSYSGR